MEPLISLTLGKGQRVFQPGDLLVCEYQIDAVERHEIEAVEASVLWRTDGKGDEDLDVHYFERRTRADAADADLRPMRRFNTRLPRSPLSYHGALIKIQWCARVRLFLRRGREICYDKPFQLGATPPVAALALV